MTDRTRDALAAAVVAGEHEEQYRTPAARGQLRVYAQASSY